MFDKPLKLKYRPINSDKFKQVATKIQNVPWPNILQSKDINESYNAFIEKIKNN